MMFSSILIFISLVVFPNLNDAAEGAAEWSYEGLTGPNYWVNISADYEDCDGAMQSPINLDTDTVMGTSYEEWVFENYTIPIGTGTDIYNNGHTIQINVEDYSVHRVSGGGLPSTYSALQLHFHWGRNNNEGSEHTKNGNSYPLELHIVHWNIMDHVQPIHGVTAPQGLAVLGVWIEIGDEENTAFNPILNEINNVTYKGQQKDLPTLFNLNDLLPTDKSRFYRYHGSLTTPLCHESVVWTVFEETVKLSSEQINKFRVASQNRPAPNPIPDNYTAPVENPIGFNFRPIQEINGRTVYFSSGQVGGTDMPTTESKAPKNSFYSETMYYVLLLSLAQFFVLLSRY